MLRSICKDLSAVFLLATSLVMLMMGLSFTFPYLSLLTLPCGGSSLRAGGRAGHLHFHVDSPHSEDQNYREHRGSGCQGSGQ